VFSKTASLNATDAITDVPWLELTAIVGQGTLAKTAFRLDTVGGQPPASVSTRIRATTDRSARPMAHSLACHTRQTTFSRHNVCIRLSVMC
jgi:hypothetical protein